MLLDYKFQNDAVTAMLGASLGQITLPTGTGKSKIQAKYLIEKIKMSQGFGIYVITTPRILLTNQLMGDVTKEFTGKSGNGIPFKRITTHSGKAVNMKTDDMDVTELKLLEMFPGEVLTNGPAILNAIDKAKEEDCPVLICSTYHSVNKVFNGLKNNYRIDALLCDESQYVVQEDFFDSIKKLKTITDNTFFFTATRKTTKAENGLGHNNENFYGPANFFTRTPRTMIDAGYIIRPRVHLVESDMTRKEGTVNTIIDSYKQHKGAVNGDPKLLIVCKGSAQLREIVENPKFKSFVRAQGTNFKLFDASSAFGHNINGKEVKREVFLDELNNHFGAAIVLHIDMLAEGINVPSMTAILPLANLKKTKFFQTLGRVTRLHEEDRKAFENGDYKPTDLGSMVKPYAYVIVPVFTDEGADRSAHIHEMISDLRDHGFDPSEDVLIKKPNGIGELEPIDMTTEPDDTRTGSMFNILFDIRHSMEDEKIASLIELNTIESFADALDLV